MNATPTSAPTECARNRLAPKLQRTAASRATPASPPAQPLRQLLQTVPLSQDACEVERSSAPLKTIHLLVNALSTNGGL